MTKTIFITSATLSMSVSLYAFNAPSTIKEPLNSPIYTTKQSLNYTYSPSDFLSQNEEIENLKILTEFTNELLKNSKPLDDDISQLINRNIMDLLS